MFLKALLLDDIITGRHLTVYAFQWLLAIDSYNKLSQFLFSRNPVIACQIYLFNGTVSVDEQR